MGQSAVSINKDVVLGQHSIIRSRNFHLHLFGTGISTIGDGFSLIALPWLVLSITSDVRQVGIVMALIGFPRAVIMLFSGPIIDCYGSRTVLVVTRSIFAILLLLLSLIIVSEYETIYIVYGFAILFGSLGAFGYPAAESLLPDLVKPDLLQQANGMVIGVQHLGQLFAPGIAGATVWWFSRTESSAMHGLSVAFLIDGLTFMFSAIIIKHISLPKKDRVNRGYSAYWYSLKEGFGHIWLDRSLRYFCLFLALFGLFGYGPFLTLLPIFVRDAFVDGTLSLGILMSANGLGALFGILLGAIIRPRKEYLGTTVLIGYLITGVSFLALSVADTLVSTAIPAVLMGLSSSFSLVIAISWVQRRTKPVMLGRVISLVMFCFMGLIPLSSALGGFAVGYFSVRPVMCVFSVLLVITSIVFMQLKSIQLMGEGR